MIPGLLAWLVASTVHVALASRRVNAILEPDASIDTRLFAAALASIGWLSVVLHVVAATAGLSLTTAIVGLATSHVAVALLLARAGSAKDRSRTLAVAVHWTERIMLGVAAAVLLAWANDATRSIDVLGPDNAHYHMPVAVNLAAGAGLFDLPATPHLYPMAGSLMTAWFILPVGAPLAADLAMALPFVLMLASINLIVRCTTGLSGVVWGTWLGLALFAAPMFRMTSLGAADLWMAAAFVAALAVVARAWTEGRCRSVDVWLGACAVGLLVGSKTTGAPAAALLVAGVVLVSLVRRMGGAAPLVLPARWPAVLAGASLVAIGAGGIWLVRNWVQFGSPVAPSGLELFGVTLFDGEPHQRTTYLSVLGELETERFRLWPSARRWIVEWFGVWYLPSLWAIVLLAADLAGTVRLRNADPRWWGRAGLLLLSLGTGAALLWMLVGAPWTALDRSAGLTLRYALPIAALLPICACVGLFPLGAAWYRRRVFRLTAWVVVAAGAGTLFVLGGDAVTPSDQPLPAPPPGLAWLPLSLPVVYLATAGRVLRGRRVRSLLLLSCLAGTWLPLVPMRMDAVMQAREAQLAREEAAYATGTAPDSAWREVFLALRAGERASGRACASRRFFALTRFDEPLALQPPSFTSQVFYAGRSVEAARRAGPIGACDYVLATEDMLGTEKGRMLREALAGGRPLERVAGTREMQVLAAAR